MTTGEVLNKVQNLTKDLLYYWEARGYIQPRKYQRGRVDKRDYSEKDFQTIAVMFKYYEKGFPPKRCYQKLMEEQRR
ncbi:MAG: MerR family transcriptional regulator [Candidatus Omnitrophica bacterium]|nr:MerR family transcriptional regulator [Candidatus Omnitrophota bacterium]